MCISTAVYPCLLCLSGTLACYGCLTSQWTLCTTPSSFPPSAHLLTTNQVLLITIWTSLYHTMTLCDSSACNKPYLIHFALYKSIYSHAQQYCILRTVILYVDLEGRRTEVLLMANSDCFPLSQDERVSDGRFPPTGAHQCSILIDGWCWMTGCSCRHPAQDKHLCGFNRSGCSQQTSIVEKGVLNQQLSVALASCCLPASLQHQYWV